MLHFVTALIFKFLFGKTLKPFGLFFWKKIAHLVLLFLSTHDLRVVIHINSQGLIPSTLFFPEFHRKVGGCSVVGRGKEGDVVEEKKLGLRRWLGKKNNYSWEFQAKKQIPSLLYNMKNGYENGYSSWVLEKLYSGLPSMVRDMRL